MFREGSKQDNFHNEAGERKRFLAYGVLGLRPGADAEEIKKAYHRLAMELHPDQNTTRDPAEIKVREERFIAVSAAYKLLTKAESGGDAALGESDDALLRIIQLFSNNEEERKLRAESLTRKQWQVLAGSEWEERYREQEGMNEEALQAIFAGINDAMWEYDRRRNEPFDEVFGQEEAAMKEGLTPEERELHAAIEALVARYNDLVNPYKELTDDPCVFEKPKDYDEYADREEQLFNGLFQSGRSREKATEILRQLGFERPADKEERFPQQLFPKDDGTGEILIYEPKAYQVHYEQFRQADKNFDLRYGNKLALVDSLTLPAKLKAYIKKARVYWSGAIFTAAASHYYSPEGVSARQEVIRLREEAERLRSILIGNYEIKSKQELQDSALMELPQRESMLYYQRAQDDYQLRRILKGAEMEKQM